MRDTFDRWRPWLERGTWAVLVMGIAGAVLGTWWVLWTNLHTPDGFRSQVSTVILLGSVGAMVREIAMVLFFFLLLRILLIVVPLLLDMREWMLAPEEAVNEDTQGTRAR